MRRWYTHDTPTGFSVQEPGRIMDFVKCKDCGNFAMIHPETGERAEAGQQVRSEGKYYYLNKQGRPRSPVPTIICLAKKQPLDEQKFKEPNELLAFISRSFSCDGFCKHELGVGPKEIDEMNAQQVSLDLQKKFLALQESMFAWRQDQAKRDQQFEQQIQALQQLRHNESIVVNKSQARGTNWQAIGAVAAVLVALISLALSILQMLPKS